MICAMRVLCHLVAQEETGVRRFRQNWPPHFLMCHVTCHIMCHMSCDTCDATCDMSHDT